VNRRGDEPRSLLRRLLKRANERITVDGQPAGTEASTESTAPHPPAMTKRTSSEASPVRPTPPETTVAPPPQIVPQPRATMSMTVPEQITSVEERLQAEEALEQLRRKTAQIAAEFAEGKLNRAQFAAMYTHFNERRVIIERLLARDPGTQAWQQVARPGHTSFLRQHFEARVLSYAIYDHASDDIDSPIVNHGTVDLPDVVIKPILTALSVVLRNHTNSKPLNPVRKQAENGRWVTVVPGKYTTAVTLFSLEPSAQQLTLVQDLHRDFERANQGALARGVRQPDQLVFPHRSLFEKPGE
jgi:hypothetical protein